MSAFAHRAAGACGLAVLGAFVVAYWSFLLVDPPLGRALAAVGLAALGALAIASVPHRHRWRAAGLRLAILAATVAGTLLAVGVPARLLLPGGWGELAAGLDAGSSALRVRQWPYRGPDEWVRLATMAVAALALSASAALASWPAGRDRRPRRALAATPLVALYCVAIAQDSPSAPVLSGLGLLAAMIAFVAAWRPAAVRPAAALVVVGLVGAASALAATRLPAAEPLVDYRNLRFGEVASFDWDHSYGPLDWPRNGDVVLEVESGEPRYWKAATLDRFDGTRWVRTPTSVGLPGAGLPATRPQRWRTSATVTVDALESELIVAPGPVLDVGGIENVYVSDDGTAGTAEDLDAGDSYEVTAYAPDPGARRLRASGERVPDELNPYTAVGTPTAAYSGGGGSARLTDDVLIFPRREAGRRRPSDAERRVLASPYRDVYRLARRLGASAPTKYDAVRAIQSYLRSRYSYSEDPPRRPYPLAAFLLRDRTGYCQQFSGAMALLLRMNRIPARVATGFSPGERQAGGSFAIRDSDAHSWVEVWFEGVGWLPFDPTPQGSPASSRAGASAVTAALGAEGQAAQIRRAGVLPGERRLARLGGAGGRDPGLRGRAPDAPAVAESPSRQSPAPAGPLLALLLVVAAVAAIRGRRRRRRARPHPGGLGELRQALERLRFPLPPGATLADLQRRLAAAGHPGAAGYVEQLSRRRYAPGYTPAPDRRARDALRRALTAGRGPLWRLRGYRALPLRRG